MDKLEKHRQIIREILSEYCNYQSNDSLKVEQKDIVIGFHPPSMRQLTEYAVG